MKRSRFTDQQVAFALNSTEPGKKVYEVCPKMGISDATFYNWKKKFGGLTPIEVRIIESQSQEAKRSVAAAHREQRPAVSSFDECWSMNFFRKSV